MLSHLDDSSNEPTPAEVAVAYPSRYMGNTAGRLGGWDVSYQNQRDGTCDVMLAGLPKRWAEKAAYLLNQCPTADAQRSEMLRIRRAMR